MAIDNPKDLSEILIRDFYGENRNIFMPCFPTTKYLDDNGEDLEEHDWDKVLTETCELDNDYTPYDPQTRHGVRLSTLVDESMKDQDL